MFGEDALLKSEMECSLIKCLYRVHIKSEKCSHKRPSCDSESEMRGIPDSYDISTEVSNWWQNSCKITGSYIKIKSNINSEFTLTELTN